MRAQRTTGMGYGTKYDFTKMVNGNPGPNSYKNLSIFDPNESKKRGFTISLGRDVGLFYLFLTSFPRPFLFNRSTLSSETKESQVQVPTQSKKSRASTKEPRLRVDQEIVPFNSRFFLSLEFGTQ